MTERNSVVCFGEILWDFLPDALYLGGAPLNVAYHLHRLGISVDIVSAIGSDVLGDEAARRLEQGGLSTGAIVRDFSRPTGYVRAILNTAREARYEFAANVAWDEIVLNAVAKEKARAAKAVVFGSLAQRATSNRAALEDLLKVVPKTSWRVFDVNLRPPFDDLARVEELMPRANVLKLNASEAARLAANEPEWPGREEIHARELAARSRCQTVCITAGDRGAGILLNDAWQWEPGMPVVVADTVGAGDAFLAALIAQLVNGETNRATLLRFASRLGEWTAAHRGATPAYDASTPQLPAAAVSR
jgi:fructokinase